MVDEYVKKGWCRVAKESKQGLWHAMNGGLNAADGEFINFMNSDDFFSDNDAIQKVVGKIIDEEADWGYGRSSMVDRQDTSKVYFDWYVPDWRAIYNGKCPNHQAVFVRTKLLRQMGGFETNQKHPYSMSDDFTMIKLVHSGHKPAVIHDKITCFRNGGASKNTGSINANAFAEYMMTKFSDLQIPEKWFKKIYYDFYFDNPRSTPSVLKYVARFTDRVQNPQWREYLSTTLKEKERQMFKLKDKYYFSLFGLLPIVWIGEYSYRNKYVFWLFGIPLITTTEYTWKKWYYLFGFIPVLKVKKWKKW
jgi:glycosyltransferase involved in cell wall biosynthesis